MLSRQLSAAKYQTLVISPRSYFVFTPLLNETAVGTLEFRNTLEPVRNRHYPNVEFIQAWADDVDLEKKTLTIEESVSDVGQALASAEDRYEQHTEEQKQSERRNKKRQGRILDIAYDKLVIAVGCYSQTFGTKGVKENAYFLKDVGDARRIRKRVLEAFEIAARPTTPKHLRKYLLHFAVIGGGPTGMEFAAVLSDLVHEDLSRLYPSLVEYVKITVYDVAPKVLSMFDESLAKYAMGVFRKEKIQIRTEHHVEELRQGLPRSKDDFADATNDEGCFTLKTKEEGETGIGMCVWATGNMMNPFVENAVKKSRVYPSASLAMSSGKQISETLQTQDWQIRSDPKTSAIVVDDHLRVQLQPTSTKEDEADADSDPEFVGSLKDVFAIGDNCVLGSAGLPATAQTANQQAIWLGKRLNKGDLEDLTFTYKDLGVMTYLGNAKGLVQTKGNSGVQGRTAWLIWKGAYLTMTVSWRNRILIPLYWLVGILHH